MNNKIKNEIHLNNIQIDYKSKNMISYGWIFVHFLQKKKNGIADNIKAQYNYSVFTIKLIKTKIIINYKI